LNILPATPECERMPTPTTDTFETLTLCSMGAGLEALLHLRERLDGVGVVVFCAPWKEMSLTDPCAADWMIMSTFNVRLAHRDEDLGRHAGLVRHVADRDLGPGCGRARLR